MKHTDGPATGDCSFAPARPTSAGGNAIFGIGRYRLTTRDRRFRLIALATVLVMTACGPAPRTSVSLPSAGEWHEFQGTWTAAGSRTIMRLGGDRRASIADFGGSLLLTGSSRPAVGFRSEVVLLNDSITGLVGRAVWTDEHGDQAFSELRGECTSTDNKIVGTFIGGTGRYSGATGMYEFSWRFLLETEDGTVQGQSVGLKGQVRVGSPNTAPDARGPRS
jgi:hypothetical protein